MAAPAPLPAAPTAAAPAAARSRRPTTASSRRTPTTTINYHYLRRDLRTLGVLAPGMVVVLVVAFIVFH